MTEVTTKAPILNKVERRILGVLVEKAKTVPDSYPLSLNGLVTGCNQKNNRDPLMNLTDTIVEDALVSLRVKGAVAEIQGSGRVPKFRHHMKEFLGIDGTELAVLTELLLRGAQTIGELRGRAARMTPGQLADLHALRPVLDSLIQKGLIIELTSAGRGQVVSHGCYQLEELEKVKREIARMGSVGAANDGEPVTRPRDTSNEWSPVESNAASKVDLAALRSEVDNLREQLTRLTSDFEEFRRLLG